jgi:arylsulfatase A-like enzyme
MARTRSNALALVVAAAVLHGGPAAASRSGGEAAGQRPNQIVIVTDDQDDALFKRSLMPHTFRLFDEGTRLTNFTIATPLCCPSRATQLTGQYGHNNGVLANDPGYGALRDPANVLPAWLRSAGYDTGQVGRYLNEYAEANGAAPAPGWDRWVGLLNFHYRGYDLSLDGRRREFDGTGPRAYVTRNLGRRAAAMVGDLAAGDAPFYLQVDHLAPHSDEAARGVCTRSALPGPQLLRPVRALHLPRNPAGESDVSDKPSYIRNLPPIDHDAYEAVLHRLRCRAAAIREADRSIGKLVRALDRTGELENTAIVFYSDNGYFNGQHRVVKSKGLPYEPSIQVPFAIRLPAGYDAVPGRLGIPAANVDIVPTLLDLAGAEPCVAMAGGERRCRVPDGRSLLPGLADPSSWPADRPILIEIDQRLSLAGGTLACSYTGVRQGGQVYVEYTRVARPGTRECHEVAEAEHYRLGSDPGERRNLWPPRTAADAADQRRLRAEMLRLERCSGNLSGTPPAGGAPPCE